MKSRVFIGIVLSLMLFVLAADAFAGPRRRGRGKSRVRIVAPSFYYGGFYPRGSFYFNYGRPFRYNNRYAYGANRMADYASVDFNVEPQDAMIYIDDALLGKVDDYNGFPGIAHIQPGTHKITIKTKDGREYSTEMYLQPGKEIDFDYEFDEIEKDAYTMVGFKVEPQDAMIYIDGAFLGEVRDFDGDSSRAHIQPGTHTITIKTRDGREYSTEMYLQPGKEIDFEYEFDEIEEN